MWTILDTGSNSAEKNMSIDSQLLDELSPDGYPILHFYDWSEICATYGCFIKPEIIFDMDIVSSIGLKLAKRPTGGGIIFHMWDFAFSILIPSNCKHFSQNIVESYKYINYHIKNALKIFISNFDNLYLLSSEDNLKEEDYYKSFCMAKSTKYDIMVSGRKIVGAAQRRKPQGYLQQCSILIASPKGDWLNHIFSKNIDIKEKILKNAFSILGKNYKESDIKKIRSDIKSQLQKELTK